MLRKIIGIKNVHPYTFFLKTASTAVPLKPVKKKSQREHVIRFDDFKKVSVYGGKGGNGAMTFLSLPFKEWAGPDGGDGGNGGHVIFKGVTGRRSLGHVPAIIKAKSGINGKSKHCHGKCADHIYIEVPLGTIVKDANYEILGELKMESETFIAARGGAGGHGNHFFLSNENRAPTEYEEGAKGEVKEIFLELRVMADIGLVGFPNAGKSTLLQALSRARPKIAAYPFTTKNPHIGMIIYDDHEQIAVADIPGLVKGAHMNYGLGFSFLRHIERCSGLLFVLDLAEEKPWEQFEDLKYELEKYHPGLSERPHAVVGNKLDLKMAPDNLNKLRAVIKDIDIIPVSAKCNINVQKLQFYLKDMYDKYK